MRVDAKLSFSSDGVADAGENLWVLQVARFFERERDDREEINGI